MDLTPIYLKMCDAAEEVQAGHTFESGDYLISGNDREIAWILGDVEFDEQKRIKFSAHEFEHFSLTDYFCKKLIWLPTQDQLQEMVEDKPIDKIQAFLAASFETKDCPNVLVAKFPSYEQLWLAFLMSERWKKFWDGFRWVADPKFEMFEKKENKNED